MTNPTRAADARNRAWRTFAQGAAFSVAAAVAVALLAAVTSSQTWTEFGGQLIAFSFFQSIAVAVLSWLMRTWLDSRTDVLAPPEDDPAPHQD